MTSSLRNTLGSVSLVVGCCLYASSNVIGHGWDIAPNPSRALLLSAVGMMLCGLSVLITPASVDRRELVSIMKAVFLFGSFSLLATLCMAVAHPFFDLDNQSWGAIPPPGLIFGALYGAISVTAVVALQLWEQQSGIVCDFVS
jgi:drug/metabolite transporter (DMT)-like permease